MQLLSKDRTPSPRQPLRLDKDTTRPLTSSSEMRNLKPLVTLVSQMTCSREKSNWSPCKWPPSSSASNDDTAFYKYTTQTKQNNLWGSKSVATKCTFVLI